MRLDDIESLIPASYNPRRVDPERLALVKLSLQKLGWLLPTYATESGELLSGHQRTYVAKTEMGYTKAPCVRLPDMDDRARKGKVAQGVPADEIVAKELSLAGVQRPLRRTEIPERAVEIFRFGDFAGWIIEG